MPPKVRPDTNITKIRPELSEVPMVSGKVGFGLSGVKFWENRVDAVRETRDFLLSPKAWSIPLLNSISLVEAIFSDIACGDRQDWLGLSNLMGNPSSFLSRKVAERLRRLQTEIFAGKYQESLEFLKDEAVVEMLDTYLSLAVDAQHPIIEEDWAYILWSPLQRQNLIVGASEGPLQSIINQYNKEKPTIAPYSVLAAWLVHDPDVAEETIENELREFYTPKGYRNLSLGEAKRRVEQALALSDNLVLSPWHVDDDTAAQRLGLTEVSQNKPSSSKLAP